MITDGLSFGQDIAILSKVSSILLSLLLNLTTIHQRNTHTHREKKILATAVVFLSAFVSVQQRKMKRVGHQCEQAIMLCVCVCVMYVLTAAVVVVATTTTTTLTDTFVFVFDHLGRYCCRNMYQIGKSRQSWLLLL